MHMSRRSFIHSMSNSLNLASMDEEASNLHVRPLNKIIRKRVFFFKNTSGKQRRGTKFLDYHRPVVNQNESSKFAKLPMTNTRRDDEKYTNRVEGGPKVQNWGNYRWSGHSFWVFSFLLLLFPFDICATDPNQCSPGLNTPGRTSPLGDIVKEYGQSLKIYCILNETLKEPKFHGKNSSDLVFYRNDREMEPEYVTVINKTTIAMYVDKPEPSSDMYYCKLRLGNGSDPSYEAVCLNKVVIGFKPKEPLNFSCISQNWENLTCTWVPAPNYVATKFSLGYKLPGRAGGRTTFNCPETKNDPKFPPNTCTWDATTDPPYRMVHENFKFVLTAENVLGINHFIYQFHHWAHVIPAKPVGLSVVNKTFSSALLHWNVPYPMGTFPPGLHHKISYQSLWDGENSWKTEHIRSAPRQDEKYFNLTNLQYANTPYDVRIFSKSALAVGEDSWSLFSDINFRTAATLPGLPVKTDIGSFEIVAKTANRDVYIYWQSIPAYLENGDNFTYKIVSVEENGKKVNLQPQEKTKTYAKFKGIGVHSFRFEIVTANCKGENEHKAVVHVPSKLEMPREPDVFTKIAFDAGLYELSWNPPRNSNVVNYTIFWCENDRDRPYQCTGYLDWVHVNRTVTVHNITVPDARKVYQFAIAANTDRASSGMVWASCTAIHNNTIGKMKSVWINRPESYQIEIGWKLECSDRIGIVEGFRIYYCPIVAPQNLNCKGEKLNRTVKADPQTMRGIVTDLKPYTTYMLSVAVLTKNGEGPASDPQYSTTLEGAPSVPLNVMVKNVTNTSMAVQWEAPVAMNGVLRYYHVHYNQNKTRVEGAQGNATQVVIEGLKPHTRYNISVSACTVTCGNLSSPIDLWTDIGVPGKMEVPAIRFMNTSQIQIVWNPPREPAGLTDFYEIETEDKIYTNITNHEKYLDIADCQTNRNRAHLFRVRAINFGPKKTRLEGPWSEAGEGTCYNSGPPDVTWMLVWIFGSLIGVAVLLFIAYSSKRLWTKCKAMQDVEVKLPPGLASNTKLLGPPNEQHLPPRSVDSSGCSSGQESVTSSLTSESHVSTDSGADLDPLPMSPTKLLESPPTWESSRLRQRIVAGTKPESCNDHEQWDSYVKVAKTLDTSAGDVLSLAKSTPNLTADITDATPSAGLYGASRQHAWSSTGYISMPSSSSSTASSEEESSNSPSPSPHGQGSNQGVYSIVGLAPPPAFATKTGVGAAAETSGANSNHPQAVNLIPLEAEPRLTTAATSNPYVSLASLEEKTKNTNMPHLTSLGNFEEMKFVHPIREVEHSQLPMSDKYCKPYVRTGLNDTMMKSCPPNELDDEDALNACYAVTGEPFGQSLIQLPKHAYVPVGTRLGALPVSSAKDSPQTQSPYVSVSTMISMLEPSSHGNQEKSAGVHDHFAPSYPFSSGITESSAATLQSLDGHGDRVISGTPSVSTSLPIVKQTSGYVTIAENPSRPIGNTTLESSTLSYVPHQQVDQKSPLSQQNVNRADEQYSKVTVVPTST
ncbi:cytokine receptor-like isoform X2 [Diprion similis]|uniref:cytokine receptor-like isoform X2 n=1 Tax=Diprion similis TaxID=362088 RepID=UPI001EF7A807|nr:cytokine receptor-like isoform X2 [Diprion similis]